MTPAKFTQNLSGFGCGRTNDKKFFCDDCIEERV